MPTLTHLWLAHDMVYVKEEHRLLLKIGALSYISGMDIHDYQSTLSPDQEDGIIEIGRCCSIGDDVHVHIYGGHDYGRITTSPLAPLVEYKDFLSPIPRENVRIGNDVWIGNGTRILSDVKIGDGAVIGAMTVVAKDIPPYAIVVGNPPRIIRYRFSESQIDSLLKIQWWNWPLEKIADNVKLFFSRDIDRFIELHGD
jgi:acetyltransferase-like isoleucine patch superfamily enzyme